MKLTILGTVAETPGLRARGRRGFGPQMQAVVDAAEAADGRWVEFETDMPNMRAGGFSTLRKHGYLVRQRQVDGVIHVYVKAPAKEAV